MAAHHRDIVDRLDDLVPRDEAARADIQAVQQQVAELSPRGRDWVALTALWYMRVKRSSRIEGATQRTVDLSDLVHSSGTILVASLVAVGTWALLIRTEQGSWSWSAGVAAALLLIVHGGGYWREHFGASGFANTDLDFQLARGIVRVIVIGVFANVCIETTAHTAAGLGYHVTLVKDATSAFSGEAMRSAHELNGPTYAHTILTTED